MYKIHQIYMRGFVLWVFLFDWGVRGKGGKLLLNFHQMLAMRHGTVEGEAQTFSLKLNFLEVLFFFFLKEWTNPSSFANVEPH